MGVTGNNPVPDHARNNFNEIVIYGLVIVSLIASTTILGVHGTLTGAQCITVFTGIIAWAAGRQGGRAFERRRNGTNGGGGQ